MIRLWPNNEKRLRKLQQDWRQTSLAVTANLFIRDSLMAQDVKEKP